MRFLSLFSGIEAASSAWLPLGWECVAVSEIDPFACAVLAHHYPDVPNLGDITKITESDIAMLGGIDLVVFGSPCQDLSVAGKRKGLDGARSGLFFSAMQIVQWARDWGDCRFALWENVPGAFSSNAGADFGVVVGQMAGLECAEIPPKGWGTEGAIVGPQGMVEWSVLDAQWAGVAQRRRRVFALADFGDWSNRPPILLESESLRGDSAPRREAGQGASRGFETGPGASRFTDVAPTLDCRAKNGPIQNQLGAGVLVGGLQRPVRVSEPVICAATGQAGAEITTGYSPTLNCNHEAPYVAYTLQHAQIGRKDEAGPQGKGWQADVAFTQDSRTSADAVVYGMQVRRLTPTECERLQAFPDGHTLITVRGKPAADGPRYKALGNSMCVNVMAWIGKQIDNTVTFY